MAKCKKVTVRRSRTPSRLAHRKPAQAAVSVVRVWNQAPGRKVQITEIDIEQILQWAYKDCGILIASVAGNSGSVARAFGINPSLFWPTSPHDAEVVHDHVGRLPSDVRGWIIDYAHSCESPEWRDLNEKKTPTFGASLRKRYSRWREALELLVESLQSEGSLRDHRVVGPAVSETPWFDVA